MHLALAFTFWQFLTHDLFHPLTGPSDPRQGGYLFWSGIAGSFILGGGIWATTITLYRKHNCHTKGCWRIGKHPAVGGKYMLCSKHHPHVPKGGAPLEQIHAEHHAWLKHEGIHPIYPPPATGPPPPEPGPPPPESPYRSDTL